MNLLRDVRKRTRIRAERVKPRVTLLVPAFLAFAMLAGNSSVLADDLDAVIHFNIDARTLDEALLQFGTQAHVQLSFQSVPVMSTPRAKVLKGDYTGHQALTEILQGTALRFVEQGKTIEIVSEAEKHNSATRTVEQHATTQSIDPPEPPTKTIKSKASSELQEIVITGTHILGLKTTASYTSSYQRNYIYSTGAGSIAQFIQQLPSNFSDASNVSVASTQGGPGFTLNNNVAAEGIDIHGLGAQSTLVLVNGYRLAPGNYNGGFVDISMLPLSAVDHIDVVADSASATYGSDAVGGVANVVTLQRFSGSETRLRYGSVTQGGRQNEQLSETLGTSWGAGSIVLSYQYSDATPLSASSRAFSSDAPAPFSLLPEEMANEVYASFTEAPWSSASMSGFAIYGHRDANAYFTEGPEAVSRDGEVNSGITELGMHKQFSWDSVGSASIEYSANDSTWIDASAILPNPAGYSALGTVYGKSSLGALDLDLSGNVGKLTWRRIRYAVGAQFRSEWYSYTDSPIHFDDSRTVASEYAELWIPILPALNLSVDDRNERYSDFGSTNNPKIGLLWRSSVGISVRTAYSTAFRAPTLYDLLNIDQAVLTPLPDTATSGACEVPGPGCTNALVLYGGNPLLHPEKAKTWTAGVEINNPSGKGYDVGLSFYDVKYYDGINTADSAVNVYNSLAEDEALLGPMLVRQNLSSAAIQALTALAGPDQTFNYGNVDPASITTLIDDRRQNIASLSTRGVDFRLGYSLRRGIIGIQSELSGTRIIQYVNQFTSLTPPVDSLNTTYNPIKLRMRLRESASVRGFLASVFVNYSGSYVNNAVTPMAPVASWTTVDASVTYTTDLSFSESLRKASITIGAFNIADRAPPYVGNPYFPVNFDGANASPLGRFIYAQLRVVL